MQKTTKTTEQRMVRMLRRLFTITALLCFTAIPAASECLPVKATFEERLNRVGWLAANDERPIPARRPAAPNLFIPTLKQTGPSFWEASPGHFYPQGTKVRVIGAIRDSKGYIDYFEVKDETGREAVVDAIHVIPFNFTKCTAQDILPEDNGLGVPIPLGKVRGLPMQLRPDAQPVDFQGRWLQKDAFEGLAYVTCFEYSRDIALPSPYAICAPVWKENIDPYSHGRALKLYVNNADLTQIVRFPD